jgi:hypothetical protein
MNKFIVTTTINKPTLALKKFSTMKGWKLIVVGDLKTPHQLYKDLIFNYLDPKKQEKLYPKLSKILGWNTVQRRNIGFLYAYHSGADLIATVDDDNIPNLEWGKKIFINKKIVASVYNSMNNFFDPIYNTEHKNLWHRGYPIQLLNGRTAKKIFKKEFECLVQADLWNGDPDVDAICRISIKPIVKFKKFSPFTTTNIAPFNSQNTFISAKILKHYFMFPFVGRMDDIWGAYVLFQTLNKKPFILFNNATVTQKRNAHNLIDDLNNELLGYNKSQYFLKKNYKKIIPEKSLRAFEIYKSYFK